MTDRELDKPKQPQEILDRLAYFYKQIDGTYNFPNSAEGDLLKMVYKWLADNPVDQLLLKARRDELQKQVDYLKTNHTVFGTEDWTEPIIEPLEIKETILDIEDRIAKLEGEIT